MGISIYLFESPSFSWPGKSKYSPRDFELQYEDYGSDIKLLTVSQEIVLRKQEY
jgi:hypothetical protein